MTSHDCELSVQQAKVLRAVAEGLPNKAIARHLGIAESTVKIHLSTVSKKIGAQNRTQAAVWVWKWRPDLLIGLTSLSL